MNNTTNTTLETLEKAYTKIHETRVNYEKAQQISDINDADATYLKLRLHELNAYREYKKEQLSAASFNRIHAPVIDYRISRVNERLRKKGVVI